MERYLHLFSPQSSGPDEPPQCPVCDFVASPPGCTTCGTPLEKAGPTTVRVARSDAYYLSVQQLLDSREL